MRVDALAGEELFIGFSGDIVEDGGTAIFKPAATDCAGAAALGPAYGGVVDGLQVRVVLPGDVDGTPEAAYTLCYASLLACLTEEDCRAAALALGLQVDDGFAGGWTTKGCYAYDVDADSAYAGSAWFGTGGTQEEMEAELISALYLNQGITRITCSASSPWIDWCGTWPLTCTHKTSNTLDRLCCVSLPPPPLDPTPRRQQRPHDDVHHLSLGLRDLDQP